ncbi:hypothetical protein EXIGLDRAFT_746432 [Exidia glandulosa HHB12029]|uniref:Uncharacterized protein n=1 Tax=Exidia glandulosa HHB12029 TaxID=1314781 RepID=A0A165M8W6_EXIGL|nr:hypothetical protein EXIGLDRAFT_746432 [Exidia glandulosa HHB12029]
MASEDAAARNDALDKLTAGPTTTKAQRRQTAYYPLVNASNKPSKPFSRSAAKRESVLQLGSIEHLQHYFTKTGLTAPTNPLEKKSNKNLVPALGPALAHINPHALPTIVADFELPPSPMIPPPQRQAFAPFERTYEVDPEALKPGVLEDLAAVVRTWGLQESAAPDASDADDAPTPTQAAPQEEGRPEFNVLIALKVTTRAIRSVRNYILALPDEPAPRVPRPFRPGSLAHKAPLPPKKHVAKHGSGDVLVRKAALDVLTMLRELEETSRIPGTDKHEPVENDADSSFLGEGFRSLTPSSSGSGGHDERRASFGGSVSGSSRSFSVPVWEDDEDEEEEDDSPKREGWDERLVLGGGWLYRTDIKLNELEPQRGIVQHWLDIVDRIVFADAEKTKSPLPMTMTLTEEPEEEPEVQDRDLPNWARRHAFGDDFDGTSESVPPRMAITACSLVIERAYALIAALVPAQLLPLLPLDGGRAELLQALSSGQLLCVAYNIGVRKSKKPWGYIDSEAIHDIANETAEKVWLFRRIENLRLFAAALKLRYLVPLVAPGQNPPPGPEPPIVFDARVVARRDAGWEETLERVVRRWVDAVVAEKRAEV